jgi:predicted XRE-type DNA-binding protein
VPGRHRWTNASCSGDTRRMKSGLHKELVHGSGNVFRDFGHANPELEQLRAILAARIIGVLNDRQLTVRKAGELTGIATADFSRIRRARLGPFTIDRLMIILDRLDQEVEVTDSVRSRATGNGPGRALHP